MKYLVNIGALKGTRDMENHNPAQKQFMIYNRLGSLNNISGSILI